MDEDSHIADSYIEIIEQVPTGNEHIVKLEYDYIPSNQNGLSALSNDSVQETNGEFVKQVKMHPCPICTNEFTAPDLRKHVQTHKSLNKYLSIPDEHKVNPCVRFYHKHDPEKYIVSMYNRTVKLHKCVLCDTELPAVELRDHLENHTSHHEYKCDQCQRVFRKINHLKTHQLKHLKELPFTCEHCDKGFVIKSNYDCHILMHNTNQELPHECTYCLRRFSNPGHLNRHIIIHTENRTYAAKYPVSKCQHCLKAFKDRTEHKAHECIPIKKVQKGKSFCNLCSNVFKNSADLYAHKRNTHRRKDYLKGLCPVCGQYVSNIYSHSARHSGKQREKNKALYQCNLCDKQLSGKRQLEQHKLVHSGLKPHICSVCAKAFNNLYNLQVHERIHKGNRCHVCNICNKGFLEKSYLRKHMNVHNKI